MSRAFYIYTDKNSRDTPTFTTYPSNTNLPLKRQKGCRNNLIVSISVFLYPFLSHGGLLFLAQPYTNTARCDKMRKNGFFGERRRPL